MTSKTLAKKLAQASFVKKAYDVAILDLRKLTSMTDFFIVCSVDSDSQARAVSDAIEEAGRAVGDKPIRREGYREGRWILLDYVDVVVHIFHNELRSFYNLEKLWNDANIEHVHDKEEPAKKPKPAAKKRSAKK
ncbi:MAG: ribosome silencing factor [Bacteroidetes bacterium]|nr:ribosome silencing factor [Bacteroidota bacterium]